ESRTRHLEAFLPERDAARRQFAEYFHHHTELHFAVRARQAAEAVLDQIASRPAGSVSRESTTGPRDHRVGVVWRWRLGIAAAAVAATIAAWLAIGHPGRGPRPTPSTVGRSASPNVAWMVNAQDCRWAPTGNRPGRDMRAGKQLCLERGLA